MMSPRSSTPTASGSPHHTPSATKTATSAGASAVPRPSKALSASTATLTRRGNSGGREHVDRRDGQAEADPHARGGAEQQRERRRVRPHDEPARDQQRHRRQVRGEADEEDALLPPARAEPGAEQRGGHRHDRLGREHRAVGGGGKAVAGRARQHGAGRRERDQRQALQQPRRVDGRDLAHVSEPLAAVRAAAAGGRPRAARSLSR